MSSIKESEMDHFLRKCEAFNTIAGKAGKATKVDLKQQLDLIKEELNETIRDLEADDYVGVLDGYTDIAVTWAGLGQMLDSLKFDTKGALLATAANNLTKFVAMRDNDEVINTIDMYNKKGNAIVVETYPPKELYVFKDVNNKVKKPFSFVSNDVSTYVGETPEKGE